MRRVHQGQRINISSYVAASFLPALLIFISLFIVEGKIKSDIDFAALELDGFHHIDAFHDLFLNLQELRRISIDYPVPLTDQADRIRKLQKETESNLQKLIAGEESLLFGTRAQIEAFSHKVSQLFQQYDKGASSDDIFLKINELVDDILLIKLVIATKSNLVLDPSHDSYHIMKLVTDEVPVIMDTVGKIEWLTAAFIADETKHMFLHSEMDSLSRALAQIKRSEEAIVKHSSNYKLLYRPLNKLIISESKNYVSIINSILHDKSTPVNYEDVSKKRRQLLYEGNQYYSKASNILKELLQKRISALKYRLIYSMAALLLAFAFSAYFITRFYYINRVLSAAYQEGDKANEELAAINVEMESTNQELLKEISEREMAEAKIKRKHLEQEILNTLLFYSLEDSSIDKVLESCLEEILSISFLPLKPQGAIFKVKEGSKELNLVSHRGMKAEVLAHCASGLLFGKCLCGRAAERGESIFGESSDPEHEIRYEGMEPHGHYCIPIKSRKGTLGVITLYLKEGHSRDESEVEFLETVAATIAGILERKKVEEALRQAKEAAEEANKLKDKFVSLVSHDLKNPIHRIAGYFDLIEATQTVSERGLEMIEEGKVACDDMMTLINEILNMNRIKGGILHLDHAFVQADKLAGQAISNYATLAGEKGISLENNIPPDFRIYADERLVLEVFRNLLSNAIKFCNRGDRVNIYVPPGEKAVIAVSDSGIGIEESRRAGLFKYDEKSSTRGTLDEGGSGLGLPLSHDIMKAHCGELSFSSTSGESTTFYIKFPHIKPVVMIIDDDESMRALFMARLEIMDVSFVEAGSGEEALALLEHSLPHLIFINVHLPGMSGLALLEKLRSMSSTEKTPVVVIIADNTVEVIDSFYKLGADDFISKPIKKEELISSVKNFIC